ncbi:MAG: geranylgeranylglycerol-phosphate geranylgeranyltransferase [Candidatus Bathyarchaeota archaeon]|nr:MAG: geranylgeranylglycerol-phosphate geranylgeranyltransferase [Candidatus Bathyarchaeota archaeon]
MQKLSGFICLIRPINCVMMGFAVIVGASLVSFVGFSINLLLGFVTSFTLTGASMAINDYYDRDIDAINEPDRPIPSGAVSPRGALLLALVLTITGFTAAIGTNFPSVSCSVIAAIAWIISVTYVTKGKRTGLVGNLLVSTCVVVPFVYGSFVVQEPRLSIVIFTAIAFFSNTGREIVKGIVDIEGDRSQDVDTIAVAYGERGAAIVSTVFLVFAMVLTPVPWALGLVSPWYLPFIIITNAGLVWSCVLLLRDYSKRNARRVKNQILLWFVIGLLAFISGIL